jgi:outer membrane biosynthesis protein TonB
MLRNFLLASALIALLGVSIAAAPFRVGGGPDPKRSPDRPIDAKKIIQDIQDDYGRALKDLEKDNPSAEARQAQQRIADGIKKLLEHEDPENKNPKSAGNPPKPKNQSVNPPPPPKPMPEQNPKPMPSEAKKAAPEAAKSPSAPKPENAERKTPPDTKPGSLNDLFGKNRQEWPSMPWRDPPQLDTIAGERFSPRHAAILREYFRALAEANQRNPDDR